MAESTLSTNADLLSCCPETTRTEDALVEALRKGDTAAFELTFNAYKSLVYNLSYRILLNKEDALDVSQEVFLTVFQKISGFRGDCSLKSWLFRITFNKSLNKRKWWNRRGRSRTEPLTLLQADRIGNGHQDRPDVSCFNHEIEHLVRSSMERLPVVQRAAILLRDLEGCSYEEIAGITGTSVGTVKSRIARARAAIQLDLGYSLRGRMP